MTVPYSSIPLIAGLVMIAAALIFGVLLQGILRWQDKSVQRKINRHHNYKKVCV